MSNHGTVRLGDVATYINGYAFKPSDWSDNGLPIIRIQNLTGNDYQTNYYNKEYNPKYLVKKGDVLISWSASLGVFVWKKEDALLNQHIFKVVFDKIDVDKDYFCLAVEYLLKRMGSEVHGSTMKHITKPRFDNTLFPLPDKDTQKQISKKIITVDKLVHKYEVIAQKLDELIKSRFVEMFGDPILNQRGFPVYELGEVIHFQGGSQPEKKYFEYEPTENNIRLIQIRDYKSDNYITYIPKSMAKRFCTADDIMIGRYGPPIFQILKGIEGAFNVALMKATPKTGNKEFIRQFLKQDCLLEYLEGLSKRTAGQDGIQMDKLKSYPFPLPPKELQNAFADFASKVEQQKVTVQKSIEKLETLKKSLMQEYFERRDDCG